MSKTLSVLILENFVINEGPKWEKVKKGVKKVGKGVATAAALGSIALAGAGGHKISGANRNYESDMAISQADYEGKLEDLKEIRFNSHRTIAKRKDLTPEIKDHLRSEITREFYNQDGENRTRREDREKEITKTRDNQHTQGKQALAGAAGLAAVPLLAGAHALGAKGKKKRQADKSLKERLNLVKSGMSLNEEDVDTTVLEKERYSDGHTPESIATLHNVPVQDILDQIERGIKVEREHTSDKDEARLIAMDHLVELPDYYTRLDKMEEEGEKELEKKQENKSLKERLELVKSGMFLNEESDDITILRELEKK